MGGEGSLWRCGRFPGNPIPPLYKTLMILYLASSLHLWYHKCIKTINTLCILWNMAITEKGVRYDYIGLTGQAADL